MEMDFKVGGGSIINTLMFSKPLRLGDELYVLNMFLDITERKRAEEDLRQRNLELETLLTIAQHLPHQLDLDELLDVISDSVVVTLPSAEAASLWLYDEKRRQLVARSWIGYEDETLSGLAFSPEMSLVGLIYRTGRPHIIHDTATDPFFEPVGRPEIDAVRSVLGVPLLVEGRCVGALFADNFSRAEAFDESDLRLLLSLAAQAGLGIKNAMLFEEVLAGQERLRTLSQQVVSAQEEERKRIAKELHDELGQTLTAIGLDLSAIKKRLPPEAAHTIKRRLASASRLTEQLDRRVSNIALDLRPYMLDDLGLVPALRWYINRYAKRSDVEVKLDVMGLEERLAPQVETALYRVVQEALTNVVKHAQANQVRIHLERTETAVVAIVEDDGRGFNAEKMASLTDPERGAGLLGIRERMALLGGTLNIRSTPGQGTRLVMEIPA
jgi:signal transduction histidine kinase